MTNYNDDSHPSQAPQIDPVQDATEAMLYADPDTAAKKFQAAIHHEAARLKAHQGRQNIIQREIASSGQVAKQFAEENSEWAKDPMIVDAIKAGMRVEQLNDFVRAGVDIGK